MLVLPFSVKMVGLRQAVADEIHIARGRADAFLGLLLECSETVETLLAELKSGLQGLYCERIRGVYVYGSYARGEGGRESDLDVLVVLDRLDSYGAEVDRTSQLVSTVSLLISKPVGIAVNDVTLR